jgi:hypothetical protein
MQLQSGSTVGWIRSMDTPENAEVVDALGDVGKEIGNGKPAFPVLAEFPGRLEQVTRFCKGNARQFEGRWLSVIPIQKRLGVKGVDVRRSTLHEQENNPLRARWQVSLRARGQFGPEKGMEGHLTEAKGSGSE